VKVLEENEFVSIQSNKENTLFMILLSHEKKTAADPCDRIIITFIHILIQMKYFIINEEFTNTFLVRYNNKGCNLYKFQIA